MSCFSLDFWEKLCIFIIIIIGLIAVAKLLLPYLLQYVPDLVVQIIRIVIWVVVAICCVIIIFGLLSCLLGMAGGLFGGSSRPFHGFALFVAAAGEYLPVHRQGYRRLLGHRTTTARV